jgi:hypothetical protein
MTGRQLSKSVSISAKGVVFAAARPNSTVMYVTPLYEQARRLSSNYVRKFIESSPLRPVWSGGLAAGKSVLQRQVYQSELQFSFAGRDADRIRGATVDYLFLDEFQDILNEHVPVIEETMSASDVRVIEFTGTPKTQEHSLHVRWMLSSQAEWVTPCGACGHRNIASAEHDLLGMIGPWSEDIGPGRPGTVCARCRRLVDPSAGHWEHRYPDRRWTHPGYHIPQVVMPLHFADQRRWGSLLQKQRSYPAFRFHNEVLGESYDVGSKLLTIADMRRAASLPWENRPRRPDPRVLEALATYPLLALGVDWGGGGKKQLSWTAMALCGLRPGGGVDVLWGRRLLTPHAHEREAAEILAALRLFSPNMVAHDYNGAGSVRETLLVRAGVPEACVMPVVYGPSARQLPVLTVPPTAVHPRRHFRADRTRILLTVASCIRTGLVRTFGWDYDPLQAGGGEDASVGEGCLLPDFLALMDDKVETRASDVYVIRKAEEKTDDFAHAVAFACAMLWHHSGAWPDLLSDVNSMARLDPDQIHRMYGPLAEPA